MALTPSGPINQDTESDLVSTGGVVVSCPVPDLQDTTNPGAKTGNTRTLLAKTTGYRALKLLSWLEQHPMSRADINAKLQALQPPSLPLSEDGIGLYINTLKAIGCVIERPSAKNQFCFVLRHNPLRTSFSASFQACQLEQFVALKQAAVRYLEVQGILDLDALLQGYLQWALPADAAQKAIKQLFERTRSVDYASYHDRIQLAFRAIETQSLLQLDYLSSQQGLQSHILLPTGLEYQRGSLYLCGLEEIHPDQSRYRFEHIRTLVPVNPLGVRQRLLPRLVAPQRFRIRLPHVPHPPPLLWGLGEVVLPSSEALSSSPISPGGEVSGCDIEVFTNDTFKLQQSLMALGTVFQILEPEWFQDHMATTLTRIHQLYHSPVNFHAPLLQQPAGAHSPPPVAYATALPSTNGHQPKGS